ncbi:30S ribosomal protein S3 [Staphylothermus hellenicus]|uniref:Small ribosomal subunit protein uS3 n=1 Tax=Staphylothermus hellenicus (strain DSM 12710 / JCM 10830 / BK20S6-10-b1 / P8) TaxID=591019 RepID=D7D9T0_STAHD|nr:30S ribosomal protein S3 [Staphylothermus hellenicus]ADI32526.1 ribosomal protein S3 [Staphylothermus hellenicus DSM 12710]
MSRPRVKSYFIDYSLKKVMLDEFLANYFKDAGYAGMELYKTPTGYRVIIYAEYPGRVIGRGGSIIRKLMTIMQTHFGLENVNITVSPVPDPDLNARVVAFRIVRALEKEIPYRRVAMAMLRRIMEAGAVGAEIIISGKLRSERARYQKLKAGRIYKAGDMVDYVVDRAVGKALLKRGVYGVEVVIVRPHLKPPDYVEIKSVKPEELADLIPVEKEEETNESTSSE